MEEENERFKWSGGPPKRKNRSGAWDPRRRSPPGCCGWNSAGAVPLRPCGGAGLLGRTGPGGLGPRSLLSGKWRQSGRPPYFPTSQLTGSERFQFRPVSAQLRHICGAILWRPGQSRAGKPGAPLLLFAVPLAESAQPCLRSRPPPGGAGHPLSPVRAAAQRTREVPGRSFPLRRGRPVRSLAWLSDLGTRPPPRRP